MITTIVRRVAKGIQSEIQQTQPSNRLEEETLVALQRTADRLQWRLSEMLKAYGLSPRPKTTHCASCGGARDQGRACSEIAQRMINRDPDIPRLLDRLERRRLVARSREGRDRRVRSSPAASLRLARSCGHRWMARSKNSTAR